jgi:hypothetical protein
MRSVFDPNIHILLELVNQDLQNEGEMLLWPEMPPSYTKRHRDWLPIQQLFTARSV